MLLAYLWWYRKEKEKESLTITCRISKIGFPTFLFQERYDLRTSIGAANQNLISVRLSPYKKSINSSWTGNTWNEKRSIHFTFQYNKRVWRRSFLISMRLSPAWYSSSCYSLHPWVTQKFNTFLTLIIVHIPIFIRTFAL